MAWLALVILAFSPVPWGFPSNSVAWGLQEREVLPYLIIAVGIIVIARDMARRRVHWYVVAWLALVVLAFGRLPWASDPIRHPFPTWVWQVVLVTSGVVLAVRPLLEYGRSRPAPELLSTKELTYAG
jgi:hypothetical protein